MLSKSSRCDKVGVLNTDKVEGIMQLPTVTARQEGATELRIFLLEEEKELLKRVAAEKGITLSHLMRSLSLTWAIQQQNESA